MKRTLNRELFFLAIHSFVFHKKCNNNAPVRNGRGS